MLFTGTVKRRFKEGAMSISQILKESFDVSKKNPLIFIPMLVTSVFSALLSLALVGSAVPMIGRFANDEMAASPEQAMAGIGTAMGGIFLVGILSGLVGLLAHGMTIGMAEAALKDERATLGLGWSRLVSRIVPMVIAAIVLAIAVRVGSMLLVLPGIIVAFLLMFTLVSVMIDQKGAFPAIGRSFQTVTKNFKATFILFLVFIALGLITGLLGFILGLIPILGVVLTMLVSAFFTGYITICLVRAYRELDVTPESAPEAEV